MWFSAMLIRWHDVSFCVAALLLFCSAAPGNLQVSEGPVRAQTANKDTCPSPTPKKHPSTHTVLFCCWSFLLLVRGGGGEGRGSFLLLFCLCFYHPEAKGL